MYPSVDFLNYVPIECCEVVQHSIDVEKLSVGPTDAAPPS